MKRLLRALPLLPLLASCGDSGTKTPDAGGEYNFEGVCRQDEGAVRVTGQWAGVADLAVEMTARPGALVALCPNPQTQPAELLMRVAITETEGGSTEVELQLCDLQLPTIMAGVATCPSNPANILELAILPGVKLAELLPTIEILFDSGVSPEVAAGTPFEPDSFLEVLGVNLDDPRDPLPYWDAAREGCMELDSLPEDCVHGYERLVDDDEDGSPGVTLTGSSGAGGLVAGEAHVTLRLGPQLYGTVRNDLCIEGTIALNLDFTIISSALNVAGLTLGTGTVIDNIPPLDFLESSRFKLLRADGEQLPFDDDGDGEVTCAEIRNNRGNFLR